MYDSMTTVAVGLDVHARSIRVAAVRADELLEDRTLPYDEIHCIFGRLSARTRRAGTGPPEGTRPQRQTKLVADGIAGGGGFASNRGRFLDGNDRGGRESQPRRERKCRSGERGRAIHFDDRSASRTICVPPEALELEALRWFPLREESEIPSLGFLARIDKVPRYVKQHRNLL